MPSNAIRIRTGNPIQPSIILGLLCFLVLQTHADELGVAAGLNVSTYKSWDKSSIEYQKTDIFNPVEVSFRKDILPFLGIRSALQYAKRSTAVTIEKTGIDPIRLVPEPTGEKITFERSINYLSLELSPAAFLSLNRIRVEARLGLGGDIYLNEWNNNFGEKDTVSRPDNISPFVLSMVGGIGVGYTIAGKIGIGLRSSFSRTLTDVFRNQNPDANIYFVNIHNMLYCSLVF